VLLRVLLRHAGAVSRPATGLLTTYQDRSVATPHGRMEVYAVFGPLYAELSRRTPGSLAKRP
jgi:hypothetical protein